MTKTKLLLVDDDNELTALLSEYLSNYNISCDIAENGQLALNKLQAQHYDLIVLDIMMPEMDGITLLKQLPTITHIPVIMLTAKDCDIDRIIGLELGADDYMGKPCNPRELLARINSVMKRNKKTVVSSQPLPQSLFKLDIEKRICSINDTEIVLTSTEFDLFYVLMKRKGEVVDKDTLSKEVLQRELSPFDRSIDVHISRLRKKLANYHPNAIKSIRGKGYQLTI